MSEIALSNVDDFEKIIEDGIFLYFRKAKKLNGWSGCSLPAHCATL